MIENKRFIAKPETVSYKDNLSGEIYCPKYEMGFYKLLNAMNDLADENGQLKQFKFNTLKLIDKHIKKYQNHLEDVEDDAVCPERYIWEIKGHLQALTELKGALNE